MSTKNWHRIAADMESERDNALAQLRHEQASRRKAEAAYRAEHEDYLRQIESERSELMGVVDSVRALMLDWEKQYRMGDRSKINLFWAANGIRAAMGAHALEDDPSRGQS